MKLDGTLQYGQLHFTSVTNLNLPNFTIFMEGNAYLSTNLLHALKMTRKQCGKHCGRPIKLRYIDIKWSELHEHFSIWMHRHLKCLHDVLNVEIEETPTTKAVIQSLAKALKLWAIILKNVCDKWQKGHNKLDEDELIREFLNFAYMYPFNPEKKEDHNVNKRPPVLDFEKLKRNINLWKSEDKKAKKPQSNLNASGPNAQNPH